MLRSGLLLTNRDHGKWDWPLIVLSHFVQVLFKGSLLFWVFFYHVRHYEDCTFHFVVLEDNKY